MDFIRPKRPSVGIDMAPLIDCVFLLLIFFMLSSSFTQPAIPLQLPVSASKDKPDTPPVTISANETGQLYVNAEPVELERIGATLQDVTMGDTSRTIQFRGDRSIRYEWFMAVVTAVREAGFMKLALQHEAPAAVATP